MIQCIVVITAKPNERTAILAAFKEVTPKVHAEEGCIEYQALVDVPNYGPVQTPFGDDTFVIVEKWESAKHLKAHATSAHMGEYAAKVKDHIKSRVVHILESS